MGLFKDYLAYLPTVKDSSMVVANMKKGNIPFNEADLAGIVLKAVPTVGKPVQPDPLDSPKVPKAVAPRPREYQVRDEQETREVGQGQGQGWYSLGWRQVQPQEKGIYGLN